MIKEVTGIDEAIRKMETIAADIRNMTLLAMDEAGEYLAERIRELTMRENPEYARSVESRTNFAQGYTIVGPTLEYAPLIELGARTRYVHYKCPWWEYIGGKLRKRVVAEPKLPGIVNQELGNCKEIIVKFLREWFKKV